jgi:D-serine deaminase-like pyridoxal phosphate-dependent protein
MRRTYEELRRAVAGEHLPLLIVDVDAFDRNVDRVVQRLARSNRRLTLRVATKSVRIPALVRRVQERGGERFRGLMCFTVREAELCAKEGFDDLFVAYPVTRPDDLERAASLASRGVDVSLAVDCEEHLVRVSRVAAERGVVLQVVICADMSLRLGLGLHLGVRRSPIATPDDARSLARAASRLPGVRLHGLMGYEAQIAGLADDRPYDTTRWAKRIVRRASVRVVEDRRRAMVFTLKSDGHRLAIVNGGGTGSLDTTMCDGTLSELTCGSAFFKPHSFDHFTNEHLRELEPACFFALEVCRIPAPGLVTCLGGGYVASGPPGLWSAPEPWLPRGVALLPAEMAGEVQTPLSTTRSEHALHLGDPVFFRHAKAGEVAEHFTEALLLEDGFRARRVPTYRGLGACFV